MSEDADRGETPTLKARAGARSSFWRSPTAKFMAVGVLTLLLAIPIFMVWALTDERTGRRDEVQSTITGEWGGRQTIGAPALVLPVSVEDIVEVDGRRETRLRNTFAAFLPEQLAITAKAESERRSLSIFSANVYTAEIEITGRFGALAPAAISQSVRSVDWSGAAVAVGLTDVTGVEVIALTLGPDKTPVELAPGLKAAQTVYGPALGAPLPAALTAGDDRSAMASGLAFRLELRLRGSERLTFLPVGKATTLALASNWRHPSFQVGMLPSERTINDAGFSATWRVPSLVRATPQAWIADGASPLDAERLIGVGFVDPVDHYTLVERALKYALMFVASIFGLIFVLEVLSKARVHVVQYTLLGLIEVFFFVLLLALAEQIGFGLAYLAAATATGGVLSLFVGLALQSRWRGLIAAGSLALLFGLLYLILRSEDVALLAGAVVGFLMLTGALFATRHVDWTGGRAPAEE